MWGHGLRDRCPWESIFPLCTTKVEQYENPTNKSIKKVELQKNSLLSIWESFWKAEQLLQSRNKRLMVYLIWVYTYFQPLHLCKDHSWCSEWCRLQCTPSWGEALESGGSTCNKEVEVRTNACDMEHLSNFMLSSQIWLICTDKWTHDMVTARYRDSTRCRR